MLWFLVLGDVDALLVQTLLELEVAFSLARVAPVVAELLVVAACFHVLRRQVLVFDLHRSLSLPIGIVACHSPGCQMYYNHWE